MATDQAFLLGEYGARLDNLEARVERIDSNVAFLVKCETERGAKERQARAVFATAGGFVGAVLAFVASFLKDWMLP